MPIKGMSPKQVMHREMHESRTMPIKGMSPKQVMHREMHEFKHGTLHSGSKSGPKVTNRKQAIAIGLSEAGKARPGKDGPDPVGRSVAAADVALPHSSMGALKGRSFHDVPFNDLKQNKPGMVSKMGEPYTPPPAKAPAKLGPAPAPASGAHGYGHAAHHREGHLRHSGDSRAHRIGKK